MSSTPASDVNTVHCVISIDVEEEGLFRGRYEREVRASNVRHLERLAFCREEFGVPLTLLVAYPATQEPEARDVLRRFQEEQGAEIGAHLHHWNTPPFENLPYPEPVRCHQLPRELLRAKLTNLTAAIEDNLGQRPRSFRMGRFDFCESLPPLLAELGYEVDSSLVPLRSEMHGPDHFSRRAGVHDLGHGLLEAPLTTVPVVEPLAGMVARLAGVMPYAARVRLQRGFTMLLGAGVHPLWYSLASMKLATRLHLARGGRVLNMFLHSSELMPGASPKVPDEAAARALAEKIRAWLTWLKAGYEMRGATLTQLASLARSKNPFFTAPS